MTAFDTRARAILTVHRDAARLTQATLNRKE